MDNQIKKKENQTALEDPLPIVTQYPMRPTIYTEYPLESERPNAVKPTQTENANDE